MASKEATTAAAASASAAPEKKEKKDVVTFAFEFKLAKAKIGAKTTNKQVKSKVNEAFMGYGAFDECRVVGDVDQDRTVYVFFARLFGKGQPVWDALQKGEPATVKLYDEDVAISLSGEKPSGGGATTGTATLAPKKEAGKKEGKGRGRGEKKSEGGAAPAGAGAPGAAAPGAEGKDDKKDGGRGRGRGPKKEEKKGPSLQRGRANVGGKLGPVSKIRLARIEKEKKEKEKAERKARGENVDEEEEKKEEDPSAHIVKPKEKEAGKKEEKGKGEAGKKGEKGKAEAGKKEEKGKGEAGKKDAGKKEAGKKGK